MGTQTPTLGIDHLKFCICYINELVQGLLDNSSIFYYDAQLGVHAITLEPLLAGDKYQSFLNLKYLYVHPFPYIPKFNISFFCNSYFVPFWWPTLSEYHDKMPSFHFQTKKFSLKAKLSHFSVIAYKVCIYKEVL